MCSPATCKTCGKTTWRGCGQHVDAVKRTVPASQWCNGKHSAEEMKAASSGSGFFSRILGR